MSPREENADLLAEITALRERVASLTRENTELQEQQSATSEVLKVIRSSPGGLQLVFDMIVRTAGVVCGALDALLWTTDGDELVVRAHHGPLPATIGARQPIHGSVAGYAVRKARVVHVEDLTQAHDFPVGRALARRLGWRTTLSAPLLREGIAIGAILIRRSEVRAFTDQQIALLQTFADQAVIAIENVRLFGELEEKNAALTQAHTQVSESLEQQTATSDILRVISSSPTDVQPVFDTIAKNAARLCDGIFGVVYRLDGEVVQMVAHYNVSPEGWAAYQALYPRSLNRQTNSGRAMLDGRVAITEDIEADTERSTATRDAARRMGLRSAVTVPLLHKGRTIGALTVGRAEPAPFSPKNVALLQTFANQAVIAIENVRLFTELEARNRDLTATSEILQVIASSPTDVQPVFDTIMRSIVRLCGAKFCVAYRYDGDQLHVVAHDNLAPETLALLNARYPQPPSRETATGISTLERRIVHIPDSTLDDVPPASREFARQQGWGSLLAVPLLRDGQPVGNIALGRVERQPFSEQQIALVRTCADQAVIAIENVRLFTELQTSNRELTTALAQQTATSEVLRTIAHTKTDPQPVFNTILRSAVRLCHAAMAAVSLTDGRMLYLPANYGSSPEAMAAVRARFPRPLDMETATGIAILTRSVGHVPDVEEPSVVEFTRQSGRVLGFRSLLTVPMLRQGEAVGAINVTRREPGPFSDAEVALLNTFADQAVIAVENVRLFRELEGANRELSAASQHKSEFLANMSHELRTPLNAIIGFSEVLSEKMFGELNEKQEEYAKDIHASGQHLLSLINDILDLSKIEAGRMELELTDFHLPTALDNALTLVRERAGRRSIELHTSIDSRLGQIQADERKVRQVVLNLLSNAIKFTPEGGRIELGAVPKDGLVEVSVSDTGVGIAPEDQEKVFEEFRQVGTADKKAEGTGLGLTLCRKFIELHGGRIWVKSQAGAGSTFTFTIPVRRGE